MTQPTIGAMLPSATMLPSAAVPAPAAPTAPAAPALAAPPAPASPLSPALSPALSTAQNAAGLVYGDTGAGKTLLLATLFLYVWLKHRLRSRYYAFDTGGYPDLMKELILAGIVEIYRPITRDPSGAQGIVAGTISKVTRGGWPVERDPYTGDGPPNVALVMPTTSVWVASCPQGHEIARASAPPNIGMLPACPACGQPTARVREEQETAPSFRGIGAIGFDSLTKMGDWCMDEMDHKAGEGVLGGLKGNMNTVFSDGEMFGTAGMSAVGFGQNRCFDWLTNAALIPGLVVPPYFTALVDKGTDKQVGTTVYAPKIVGTARGYQVPREVGNCLLARKEGDSFKLYLKGVVGENGVPYLAKVRSADVSLPAYLEDPPGATLENGLLFSRFSLGHLHELLEHAAGRVRKALADKLAGAPGIGSGAVAPGEMALAVRAQPSAVQVGVGGGSGAGSGQAAGPSAGPTAAGPTAGPSAGPSVNQAIPQTLVQVPMQVPAPAPAGPAARITGFPLIAPAGSPALPSASATTPSASLAPVIVPGVSG